MSEATYLVGDVFDRMAELDDHSVDLIVTSPPFLALRSYLPADHQHKGKEIGSEATPAAFLSTLLALTREWRRILAPHGSICVELGDTYSGSGGAGGDYNEEGQAKFDGSARRNRGGMGGRASMVDKATGGHHMGGNGWPLPKSLCLLPTLYPASLAYGRNLLEPADVIDPWRVRNLIVWHRPNPPVGALGDKVRPSTSYITTACVSGTRWFDLDAERTPGPSMDRNGEKRGSGYAAKSGTDGVSGFSRDCPTITNHPAGAPPLDCWFQPHDELNAASPDVWTIPTAPYQGSHYATFPPALPRKLINLMCPRHVCTTCGQPRRRLTEPSAAYSEYMGKAFGNTEVKSMHKTESGRGIPSSMRSQGRGGLTAQIETLGWSDCGHNTWRRGIVLDPFAGSGTTLMAASELGRDSIGIDLDERNLDLARQRCGLFLQEATS